MPSLLDGPREVRSRQFIFFLALASNPLLKNYNLLISVFSDPLCSLD